MASAMGPVFDFLLGDPLKAALLAVNPLVDVVDGFDSSGADDRLVIGRADPGDSAPSLDGTQMHLELGAQRIEERFDVPCYFDSWRGGGEASQAETRDAVLDLFNALVTYLQLDLTLGGALNRYAEITAVRMIPTPDLEHANDGRRQILFFTITCKNKF